MSNNQQPAHIPQIPQAITQYQQQIEFFNNQIAMIRRNMERPDISNEEKEAARKQEQEAQSKLIMLQTIVNQMVAQRVIQQQQQQQQQSMGSPSSQQTGDNMSVSSTPGSPATFNQQQQQQQFAAAQLRSQQQQQQQATLSKMGLAAQQLNAPSPVQNAFASPINQQQQQQQQMKPNPALNTTTAAAVAAAAAAAAVKNNNNMFTFPTQPQPQQQPQQQQPSTPTSSTPAALKTATTAPSMDYDGVNRVLTKRKIQELVSQIDPSERLEPEVEDILLEIADEFIESVTTFACHLAKHRKSDTLEVKDVQLHLERNWNIRIPGFAADDIRPLRKPTTPSSHQSKVQAVSAAKSQIANSSSKKDNQ